MSVLDEINTLLEKIPVWKTLVALPVRVEALEQKVANLEALLSGVNEPQRDFVPSNGALFWLDDDAKAESVVYCPRCKISTAPFAGTQTFVCSQCSWESPFTQQELPNIIKRLNG